MKKLILVPFILFLFERTHAQRFEWLAHSEITSGFIENSIIRSDPQGNIVALGRFSGDMIIATDTLHGPGGIAYYLAKLSPSGVPQWSKWFTLGGGDYSDMCIDKNGDIYLSISQNILPVYVDADTTFSPVPGHWVLSFNADGKIRWIIGGMGSEITPLAASLFHPGFFAGSLGFLKHFDSNGALVWQSTFTSGLGYFNGLEVSNGRWLVASARTVVTGMQMLDTVRVSSSFESNDQLIFQMDTSGTVLWGRNLPYASNNPYGTVPVDIDGAGEVFVVFNSGTNVPQYIFAEDTLTNPYGPGIQYAGVLKYNSSGEPQWARGNFYGTSHCLYYDMTVSAVKEVICCGSYQGTVFVDGQQLATAAGNPTAVVVEINNLGDLLWTKQDPRMAANYYDEAYSVINGLNGTYTVSGILTGPSGEFYAGCNHSFQPNYGGIYVVSISEQTDSVPLAAFSYTGDGFIYTFTDYSTNATSWHWDFGDGNTSELPSPVHEYAIGGNYTVNLTVYFGNCSSSTTEQLLHVSVDPADGDNLFSVFPNPVDDELIVHIAEHVERITISDIAGQELYSADTGSNKEELRIATQSFVPGLYFILAEDGSKHRIIKKFVKN